MVTVSAGKHRRFEEEPLGAPEYFRAPPGVAGPAAGSSGAWGPAPAAALGPQAGQLVGYPGSNGSPASPVSDWPPDSVGTSWPQWGGPPPALHPDHPSAPVPRVRVPQAPAQAGPVMPGRAAPGTPSGPMAPPAGPPRLPRRRPAGPGPSGSPNAGPRFNGAGPRAGGPGPANRPARPGGPGWAATPAGPPAGPAGPSGFARPGRPAGPSGAPRPNRPARAGGPAQDYSTGQGFGPPPGQSYRPANGGGRGPAAPARTNSTAPQQGYNGGQGRPPAPQFPSRPTPPRRMDAGQGYPQPPDPQAGRRLYAVPGSSAPGAQGMGTAPPADGRMAQFGGGQAAVALADPAWQGGPRDSDPFRDGRRPAMPGGQAPAVAQAWSQATAIRERAEQDAAAIRQEALAIREAAEREAADMRAAVSSMSEQLGRMAAYLSENFPSGGAATALAAAPAALAAAPPAVLPTRPTPRPAAPGTRPRPAPATRPDRPAARPDRPVTKPGKSTTRPGTSQGRQVRAARKMFALLAILVTAGTITGTAQIVLHGGRFFIFRENGAGASETGLTDSQFPGHPGAPAPPKHAK